MQIPEEWGTDTWINNNAEFVTAFAIVSSVFYQCFTSFINDINND